MTRALVTALAAAVLGFPRLLDAQEEDLKRRLEAAEKRLGDLERERLEQRNNDDSELKASFSEGLRFRSGDGDFDIHVGGRFIEHFRHIFGRPDGPTAAGLSRTQPDTFYVKEAFLSTDGTLWKQFRYKINGDFATSAGGPVTQLEEGYAEWKISDELIFRFGQFKTPNGQEILTSTLFIDTIERSILTRFVPNLELGFEYYGTMGGGLFSYQCAFTNGRSHLNSGGRARNDDNDEKEFLARFTSNPFARSADSVFYPLRVGVWGSISDVDDVPMDPNFDVATTELNVTYLDSTAGFLNGRRTRLGAELAWALGPASIRGEWMLRRDRVNDLADTVERSLPTRAWTAQVTCFVFGADKFVDARPLPVHPVNLGKGDWGAVEVVFRAACAEVGKVPFLAVGNSLVGQSRQAMTYTAGVNWYLSRNVRFSVNVVYEAYEDKVDFGNGVARESLVGLLGRFQIDF